MSRSVDTAQSNALVAPHFSGIAFVELMFAVPLRVCTLGYPVDWNGYTWAGAGNLGSISPIGENSDLQAQGVNLTLTGIDPSLIQTALAEQYQGKQAQIWFCPLDGNGQRIGSPIRIFNGRIDTMSIEAGKTATITLACESKLIDFFRPRVSRFNDADQQAKYPGDRGMEYAEQMVDKQITWGFS